MEIYSFVVHHMLDQLLGFKFQDTGSPASGGRLFSSSPCRWSDPCDDCEEHYILIHRICSNVTRLPALIRYRRDKFGLGTSEMHQDGIVR